MSTTIERVRLFAAAIVGIGLILTAALTPSAVRPPIGPAPAHGNVLAAAVQEHVDDDPQELRGMLACMFGLPSVNEHTVLMLEGEQAGTVNGALFDTDAGAFVTPIAPLSLLWVDPIAFDVPPIDLGAEGLLQPRWKMGVIDLGTASPCGPFVVGLMICLDGTCPDASTATMVLFAPSGFHATYSGALEEAVAARGAVERSAGEEMPPSPSGTGSGSGGSIPIVPMPTVTRGDCDPAAYAAQAAACLGLPICDRLICQLQHCRRRAACTLLDARTAARLDYNERLALTVPVFTGGSLMVICGGKIGLLYYIGSRITGYSLLAYAKWRLQIDTVKAERNYQRDLVDCISLFEIAWKDHNCP
jgi:hypothetical protein